MTSCRRAGISLLEVVVGMTIIGLAVTSALATSAEDLRATSRAVAVLESNALAEMKLNEALIDPGLASPIGVPSDYQLFSAPMSEYEWRAIRRRTVAGVEIITVTVRSDMAERTLEGVAPRRSVQSW